MASLGLTACDSQEQPIHQPFFQKSTEIDSPLTRVCNRLSGYSGYSDIRKNLSVRITI